MIDTVIKVKICRLCSLELPLELFYIDKAKKFGVSTYCRECSKQKEKAKYIPHPKPKLSDEEKIIRRRRSKQKYKETHPEMVQKHNISDKSRARSAKWRIEHKEYDRAFKRGHYETNKLKIRAKQTADYAKNPEPFKKRARDRRINDPSKVNAEKAERKAWIRAGRKEMSKEEYKAVSAFYKAFPSKQYAIDHIIPLAPKTKRLGVHRLGNLQAIPRQLNANKGTKIGRFSPHPLGICCLPSFEGVKREWLEAIHGGSIDIDEIGEEPPERGEVSTCQHVI